MNRRSARTAPRQSGKYTRRTVVRGTGAALGVGVAGSLAGCSGVGGDQAVYWSDRGQMDVDYATVMAAARDADYEVVEPYYVGTTEARGLDPGPIAALESRLGPAYRVFGFTFFYTEYAFAEFWLTGETPTVSFFDDRTTVAEFPIESLPPDSWLVDRFTLAFDISESEARELAADLRQQVAEGTDIPKVEIDAAVEFDRVYAWIEAERTEVSGSETGGDGWYKETSLRNGERIAEVDFVVQSMETRRTDGDRTYIFKLDRLGGFYLQITLPAGEEIPEDEYRHVFRQMFENLDLPPDIVADREFEYSASKW